MKNTLLGGVAIVGMIAAGGGSAEAASPAYDWSGLYVGAHVGLGWAGFSGVTENGASSASFADKLNLTGVAGGALAGYNWQWDNVVVGIEGDVTIPDWKDSQLAPTSDDEGLSGKANLLATVRARLGYTVDKALFYVTGGLAYADASATSWRDGSTGKVDFSTLGGVVGLGAEGVITDSLSLRMEGLYYMFGDNKSAENLPPDSPESNSGDHLGLDNAFTLRVALSYRFDLFQ
jgi:outer membrane immunogenic protein